MLRRNVNNDSPWRERAAITPTLLINYNSPSTSTQLERSHSKDAPSNVDLDEIARQSLPTSINPLQFGNDKSMSMMQLTALETLAQKNNGRLTPDGRVMLGLAYDVLGRDPDED
ncbi:hypothetical protein EW146_g4592 [Bondarzewia mesenterica]|uniref:Uncharacterized protein n=1 Tax=Bondarzewia mesenterica TaxID=1095465 RepID=A0A4S4LVX6_9AGAM|nr:hypothetical protein EW146_g4592 [Bondarzewia mesenterica]